MITLEHADLEFPGYFASVGAEVTGTGMVHLCVGSEPDDDDENSAVIRITADGAEELARALTERAGVARRAASEGTEAVTDIHAQQRERYERAAAALRERLEGFMDRGFVDAFAPPTLLFYQVAGRLWREVREAEEADRRQWIGEVKHRLGIVTMADGQP